MIDLKNGVFHIGTLSYDPKDDVEDLFDAILEMRNRGETFITLNFNLPRAVNLWKDKRIHAQVIFFGERFSYLEALERELNKCGGDYKAAEEIWKYIKALKCRLGGNNEDLYYSPITQKYYISHDFSSGKNQVLLFDVSMIEEIIAGKESYQELKKRLAA